MLIWTPELAPSQEEDEQVPDDEMQSEEHESPEGDQQEQAELYSRAINILKAFNPMTQLLLHQYCRFYRDGDFNLGEHERRRRWLNLSRSVLEVELFFREGLKSWSNEDKFQWLVTNDVETAHAIRSKRYDAKH